MEGNEVRSFVGADFLEHRRVGGIQNFAAK